MAKAQDGDAKPREIRYSELLKGQQVPGGADDEHREVGNLRMRDLPVSRGAEAAGVPPDLEGERLLTVLEQERESFSRLYDELYQYVSKVLNSVEKEEPFPIDEAFRLIGQLVGTPRALNTLIYRGIESPASKGFLVTHAINVAVFALKIAVGLRYDEARLSEVGVAALLHDVGMATLPKEIVFAPRKLTAQEFAVVRTHTRRGRDIILAQGEKYRWLAEVIDQTHEREGGSGYGGLKGQEVHEYAKIIGLADVYEAMTHQRPHKKAIIPFYTVKQILEMRRGLFSDRLIKALVRQLTVFPLYSYVKLNTGVIGQVVDTSEEHPMKPTVVIKYDAKGEPLSKPKVIKLIEFPLLYIVSSVEIGQEVSAR